MNPGNSTDSRYFISHYSDIYKPHRRIWIVGRQHDVGSNHLYRTDHSVNDPGVAHPFEPFQRSAQSTRCPSCQDDAQRRGGNQIRNPRRSAAASRSIVRARSIIGGCIPSNWRSLMYRAHA